MKFVFTNAFLEHALERGIGDDIEAHPRLFEPQRSSPQKFRRDPWYQIGI